MCWTRRLVAAALVVLLGLAASGAWAQQVSPALLEAARQAYQQGQQRQPEIPVPTQMQSQVPPASEKDWNNLSQLQVGARIVVETMDNIRHHGKFIAYSDEAISLREGKREVGYRRGYVLQVSLLGRRNRGKAASVGLIIGFAGGAITAAAKWGGEGDLTAFGKAILILGTGGLFGGIGAGVGAAVAPRPKTVIYRVGP